MFKFFDWILVVKLLEAASAGLASTRLAGGADLPYMISS